MPESFFLHTLLFQLSNSNFPCFPDSVPLIVGHFTGSDLVSDDLVPFIQAVALLTVLTMAITDIMARCLFKRPTHQTTSGVINNLINFSSLNLVIILVILYRIFVSLVFKQFATYGTTGTLGLLGFVVMNKQVRVHIFVRARRRLEMATVGGGEGLVTRMGWFSRRVEGSTSAGSEHHPVSHPGVGAGHLGVGAGYHGVGAGHHGVGAGHPGVGAGHPGVGAGHPGVGAGHPGVRAAAGAPRAVFTVSAGHSQVGLKEGERRGAPRQAW